MEFNKFKQLLETNGFTAENDYSNSTDMQTIVKKKKVLTLTVSWIHPEFKTALSGGGHLHGRV